MKYDLTTTSWLHFEPQTPTEYAIPLSPFEHGLLYSKSIDFNTPPLGTPAVLSYLALMNMNKGRSIPLPPSHSKVSEKQFQEWNCEWERCFTAVGSPKRNVSICFRPGRYLFLSLRHFKKIMITFFDNIAWKVFGKVFSR